MRRLLLFSVAAVLAFVVTPSLAEPTTDSFFIFINYDGFLIGGGSGFNDGTGVDGSPWYYYPNTGWCNQWFYDAPPDPTRYKEITYDIVIDTGNQSWVTLALNWSTLAYPETGPDGSPPLPPLTLQEENDWIVREIIFDEWLDGHTNISGTFTIPDYNPEWVSIDIKVFTTSVASASGIISHECIPAPGAIVLGSIGIGLVGWLRSRRAF